MPENRVEKFLQDIQKGAADLLEHSGVEQNQLGLDNEERSVLRTNSLVSYALRGGNLVRLLDFDQILSTSKIG